MITHHPAGRRRTRPLARFTPALTALAILVGACTDATSTPRSAPPSLVREALRSTGTDACQNCVVGPVTLTRTTADPQVVTYTFPGDPTADYILDVTDNGSRGLTGSVKLNGVERVTPDMLGGNDGFTLHQPVTVADQNTLEIRLAGKPGATMSIMLTSGVKLIGPEGGTIRSPGGIAVLNVPPGALSTASELSVSVGGAAPVGTHSSIELVAPPIELLPEGTRFSVPAVLTVRPTILVDDVTDLALEQYLPGSDMLRRLNQRVDAIAGTVSVDLSHFSLYWLGNMKPFPATSAVSWSLFDLPSQVQVTGSDAQAELEADAANALNQWRVALEGSGLSFQNAGANDETADLLVVAMTPAEAAYEFALDPLDPTQGIVPGAATLRHRQTGQRVIVVNDEFTWHSSQYVAASTIGRTNGASQWEVMLLHEFGHALGIQGHLAASAPPIMAESYHMPAPSPLRCEDVDAMRKEYKLSRPSDRCATTLAIVQPEPTSGTESAPLTPAPAVIVRDRSGMPLEGVPVIFYVPVGSPGTVMGRMQYTDANGEARPSGWTLGAAGTVNQLTAKVELLAPNEFPNIAEVTFSVTAIAAEVLVFSDDFSNGLGNWIERDPNGLGSWWTSSDELLGNYNIGCGSPGCYQLDLLLSDAFQQGAANWRAEIQSGVTQAYCCYNGGATVNIAKFLLYVSDSEKESIEVGGVWQGLTAPASQNSVNVSHQKYPWTWVNSPTNNVVAVAPWVPAQFQTATLTRLGDEYILTWNGVEVYRTTRGQFSAPPKIGLHTYGQVRMDNFKLYRLP